MTFFDVPILLEFYARPDKFIKVFNAVKAVKPLKLFLYQDAPKSQKDRDGWEECRKIINTIDWPCEIKTFYQEENKGCDPSGYLAQKWFFDNVEYGIVLEDDCVPCISFFYFCKEMLEKYRFDDQIAFISGMNVLDKFPNKEENKASYFFTAHGGIWGWASWNRFYKQCDPTYSWLDDKQKIKIIFNDFYSKREARQFIKLAKKRRLEKKEYFETIVYANARLNKQLQIVPCVNLVSNIGIGDFGTHGPKSLKKLPPKVRKLFFKETFEISKPYIFPKYKIRNFSYERKIKPSIFENLSYKFYNLLYLLSKRNK